jgi:hypothetical protein
MIDRPEGALGRHILRRVIARGRRTRARTSAPRIDPGGQLTPSRDVGDLSLLAQDIKITRYGSVHTGRSPALAKFGQLLT